MADGITLNAGTGGEVIASDDIGGVQYQRVKPNFGADGSATDVSAANPFPVTGDVLSRIALSAGDYSGYSAVNKFGFNLDVDTAASEDIWSAGGTYNWLTSATLVEAVSGSGDDTSIGAGARTIQIWGLDSDYEEQSEIISLNGTTAVDSTNTYIRVFRAKVLTAGGNGTAGGTITVRVDGGGNTVAEIPLGRNQTEMAVYTVPAGKTAYVFSLWASCADASTRAYVGVGLRVRDFGGVFCAKFNVNLATDGTNAVERHFVTPMKVTEKSDIVMTATTSINGTQMVGAFDLILVDD